MTLLIPFLLRWNIILEQIGSENVNALMQVEVDEEIDTPLFGNEDTMNVLQHVLQDMTEYVHMLSASVLPSSSGIGMSEFLRRSIINQTNDDSHSKLFTPVQEESTVKSYCRVAARLICLLIRYKQEDVADANLPNFVEYPSEQWTSFSLVYQQYYNCSKGCPALRMSKNKGYYM